MNIKKISYSLLLAFEISNAIQAQSDVAKITDNDLSGFKPLSVQNFVSFYIPPTRATGGLGVNLNINGMYTMPKTAQLRVGIGVGVFNGLRFGTTYYLKNSEKMANYKFVVSRSSSGNSTTTKYYVQQAKVKNIIGPAADLQIGFLKGAGFYTRLDFGFDFQTFGKAYSERNGQVYAGNRNGWASIKAQVVLANVYFDARFPEIDQRRMQVGFQMAPQISNRPWKRVCLYGALPLGFVKTLGVADDAIIPILSIDLGMSIQLGK